MLIRALMFVATITTLFVPDLSFAQVTIDDRLAPGQPPVIIAHRAKGGSAPENSLAGIQHAIERGIGMVEVDVQMVRDGQYILMHDPVLFTTTNVAEVFPEGAPSREPGDPYARRHFATDYTLEDIAQLRLLDPQGGEHPVPSLDAVLKLAEGRVLVILELKRWELESLLAVLAPFDTSNLLLFSNSDPYKLRDTAMSAGIGVFATLERARDYGRELDKQIDMFGPQLKMVDVTPENFTPDFIAKATEHGVRIAIDGMGKADESLAAGDTEPWKNLLELEAAAYWTALPDEVTDLLD